MLLHGEHVSNPRASPCSVKRSTDLRESESWRFSHINDRSKRRGDDDSLDRRRTPLDGFQEPNSPIDSRIKQILLNIRGIEMERTRSVHDCFKRGVGNNSLVERYTRSSSTSTNPLLSFRAENSWSPLHTIQLRNILHNHKIKSVFRRARVRVSDLLSLGLGAHGGYDRVAAFEERVEDMCGDEAASA